jgi:Holliday junction resolvasome RuvABC ATP-dependent DNA helicase subunit
MNIPFSPSNIKTGSDVKAFFVWLVMDQNLNFNPDTPFEDYVRFETGEPIYTAEEATQLKEIMDRCFEINDVYEIGFGVIKELVFPEMGVDYDEIDEKWVNPMIRKYNLRQENISQVATTIASEVIQHGKSTGWQGWNKEIDEVAVLSNVLNKYNILYVDDIYGTWEYYSPIDTNPEK